MNRIHKFIEDKVGKDVLKLSDKKEQRVINVEAKQQKGKK